MNAVVDQLHDHVVAGERRAHDPGSRCRNGRIALKRWVTVATPRSKALFACSAVASLCPSDTVTPRSSSRSITGRAGELRRERHRAHRAAVEQPLEQRQVGIAARAGDVRPESPRREEGPLEVRPEDARILRLARHLRERGEQRLLGRGDQRRLVGGHAGLEQRLARPAVAGRVGVEEVDAAEPVHLQVDEAREPRCGSRPGSRARSARCARRRSRRRPRRTHRRSERGFDSELHVATI